jgi:hypothetical protein
MYVADSEGQSFNKAISYGGGIVGAFAIIVLCLWVYGTFIHKDYSKPWWTGDSSQQVCDATEVTTCYTLIVNSNGKSITPVHFPNGKNVTPASSSCAKREGVGKVCTFTEPNGKEWDVVPL